MYSHFFNQLFHLIHYGVAFSLVMILIPKIIFINKHKEDWLEQIVVNYIKMVLFIALVGYFLIVTRLFEVISVLVVWVFMAFLKYNKNHNKEKSLIDFKRWIFDYMEGLIKLGGLIKHWFFDSVKHRLQLLLEKFSNRQNILITILFLIVFISSIYYRFQDAMIHAAPNMSDSYVTLAWMKYNSCRDVSLCFFYDGIYPQGYHIYLAMINKFASIDELYILKYTGPLTSVLTMFGFYFVVSRMTHSKISGIVSALIYGMFSVVISETFWMRQAASNSQEFAFIFVMPTLYFFFKYLQEGNKRDYWVGAAGVAVTGLVHSFAQGFIGLGMLALIAAALLLNFKAQLRKSIEISLAGLASLVIAAAPLGLGLLMGKKVNDSSSDFLTSPNPTQFVLPSLQLIDLITLGCLGLVLIFFGFSLKSRKDSLLYLYTIFMTCGTFLIFDIGGLVTDNELISSRAIELWALTIPYSIAIGWYVLFTFFKRMKGIIVVEWSCCALLVASAFIFIQPIPIAPYKMESDQSVEQYLRIAKLYRPKSWTIFSQEEGYALAYGNGYHKFIRDLLTDYDPSKPALTKIGQNKIDKDISLDVFLYYEKNIYKVSEQNAIYPLVKPRYERRAAEMIQLIDWIERFKQAGNKINIFYEDTNLIIYHIHRDETIEEKQEKLWGKPKETRDKEGEMIK